MSCEEVNDRLPDYTLGTLPETEAASVRAHLRGCTACRSLASAMDEGVATFASATHARDPAPGLRNRVLSVLAEEWAEAPTPSLARRRGAPPWYALAAVVVAVGGMLAWGISGHLTASRLRPDALSYRTFLQTLGGTEVRVGTIEPRSGSGLTGTLVLYDSTKEQSWGVVLVRGPTVKGEIAVSFSDPSGRTIETFPILMKDGRGATWMVTSEDTKAINQVRLVNGQGRVLAIGTARHT